MTREEAIKEIRSWDFLEGKEIEAIETLIPELKESKDERIRKAIISITNQYARMCEKEGDPCEASLINDALAYLEKQKEQKSAEWSEEDENALEYLHELIGFGYSEKFMDAQTAADMRAWVNKSLRHHPHWKPSEEQIAALDKAIPVCMGVFGRDEIMPLESLYEQLKRIKEDEK